MTLSGEDRLALVDLVHRYAAYVDERDTAAAAALFTDDGVLAVPAPPQTLTPAREAVGVDQIRTTLGSVHDLVRTVHSVGGVVLDADGDAVRGRVSATAHHVSSRGGELTDVVWHLSYRDSYRRTPQGWRFARRELVIDLVESRSVARARPHGTDGEDG